MPLDDVEVGHHVAGIVPDEAGAGAARHGKDIARPDVTHQLRRGDVNHRPARFLEQFDGGFSSAARSPRGVTVRSPLRAD
jgi:hypothetical protein